MVRLIAKSALAGHLPRTIGGIAIHEVQPGPVTSIAPLARAVAEVSADLAALGLRWPAPGEALDAGAARIVWAGRETALLMGCVPPDGLGARAALTDQTGALAMVRLSGEGLEEALARLIPVDLTIAALAPGATRQTLIGHMRGSVTRLAPDAFEVAVTRSMGESLVDDLERAIATWAARP